MRTLLFLFGVFILSGCGAKNAPAPLTPLPVTARAPSNEQLREQMHIAFRQMGAPPSSIYQIERHDLNGDGRREAIILINAPHKYWCTMDGCTMMVLEAQNNRFRHISTITPVRAPVYIIPATTNGWKTLTTRVAGRQGKAFDAVLAFNGIKYPSAPNKTSIGVDHIRGHRGIRLFYD